MPYPAAPLIPPLGHPAGVRARTGEGGGTYRSWWGEADLGSQQRPSDGLRAPKMS